MKNNILILFFLALCSMASAQTNYDEEHEEENFSLNTTLNSNRSYHYTASSRIDLNPGFSYAPNTGKSALFEIDEMMVFPPSAGITGGPNPTVDNGVVGAIGGTVNVSALGGAVYSIPIMTPPGIGNMTPNIAITYNNQAGNGLLGWGWNLSGLSSIARTGQTLYHDNNETAINLVGDRYVLDGNRLMLCSGTYGENGSIYKTEIDEISKIVAYSEGYSGPSRFVVYKIDGTIWEYGHTDDSRIEPQNRNDVVLTWLVNKISDRDGNSIVFHYNENQSSGEWYVNNIEYTLNEISGVNTMYKVEFVYDDRADIESGYICSNAVLNKKILKNIVIKHMMTSSVLYEYSFEYMAPNKNSVSNDFFLYNRLKKISLTANGLDLNPTVISWNSKTKHYPDNFQIDSLTQNVFNKVPFVGDFNGDGYSDVALVPYKTGSSYEHDVLVKLYLNKGDGTFENTPFFTMTINQMLDWIYVVDLNGDGLDDLVAYFENDDSKSGWKSKVYAYINMGNTFLFVGEKISDKYFTLYPGDFCHERKTSLFVQHIPDSNGNTKYSGILYFNENTQQLKYFEFQAFFAVTAQRVFVTDIDSDSHSEIMLLYNDHATIANISKNENGNYVLNSLYTDNNFNSEDYLFPGDFNGDGHMDLLKYNNYSNRIYWEVALSDGDKLMTPETCMANNLLQGLTLAPQDRYVYSLQKLSVPSETIRTADFDGDGKTDVAVIKHAAGNYYTMIGFKMYKKADGGYDFKDKKRYDFDINTGHQYVHVGNFLGRENISILSSVRENPSSTEIPKIVSLYPQSAKYSVERITDGLGNRHGFKYEYLMPKNTNPFYEYDYQWVNDDVRTIPIPVRALCADTVFAINNIRCVTTYSYKNLFFNNKGRGVLGFESNESKYFINNELQQSNYCENNLDFIEDYNVLLPKTCLKHNYCNQLAASEDYSYKIYTCTQNDKVLMPLLKCKNTVTYDNDNPGAILKTKVENIDYQNYSSPNHYVDIVNIASTTIGEDATYTGEDAESCTYWTRKDYIYKNAIINWLVCRVSKETVTSHTSASEHGTTDIKNSITYTYDSNRPHLLKTEILKPNDDGNNRFVLQTDYTYSPNTGVINKITKKVSALNDATVEDRTTIIEYGSQYQYRFPTKTTNSMGYVSTSTYNPMFGWKLSDIDCNGLVTTYETDLFGLDDKTTIPDGTVSIASKRWSFGHNDALPDAMYYTWTKGTGTYPSMTFYHKTGVPLRYVSHGIDGQTIYVDREYDNKGNLYKESLPYEAGNTPDGYTTYLYDQFNRVILTVYPDGTSDEVVYRGNEISYIHHDAGDISSQTTTKKYHPNGWLEQTTDSGGNTVKYVYNSDGSLHSSYVDGFNAPITITYNEAGLRTSINDPDYGLMQYNYNAFGELIYQKTPKNVITEYDYDKLSRKTHRTMKVTGSSDEITIWDYSTQAGLLGTLERIRYGSNLQTITYQYDELLRLIGSNETFNGVTYSSSYTYDEIGRLSTETYPSGMAVKNQYNNGGYLRAVKDLDDNVLWRADKHDIYGHLTQFHTGNGLTTYRDYDSENGRLLGIITADDRNIFQNYVYTYDDFGNFASRIKNVSPMLQEDFTYDNFNRLTGINTNGTTYSMAYDRYGRMESKSQYGFAFDNARYSTDHPHAVSRVQAHHQPPFAGHTVTYTPFDKVQTVIMGNNNLHIDYGYDRQRIRMTETIGGNQRVKTYVGNCEFIQPSTGDNYSLTYLSSTDGIFAVAESTSNGYRLHYVHTDNLGSWDIITDMGGSLEQSLSFDAWGNQRNASTWNGLANDTPLFDRGFTGHEHLYNFGLINMNGRVYDPYLSTFLSPDNYIQCPDNSQNFNRYAYCLNNPLKYTDPSGEVFGVDDIIIAAVIGAMVNMAYQGFSGNIKSAGDCFAAIGIGALGGAVGGAAGGAVYSAIPCSGFIGGALSGGASGFSSSFTTTYGNSRYQGNSISSSLDYACEAGLTGLACGTVVGGVAQGIQDYGNGYTFWKGEGQIEEFVLASENITTNDTWASNYNNSPQAKANDMFLTDRMESYGFTKGKYNIRTITTKFDENKYYLNNRGLYYSKSGGRTVPGYCQLNKSGTANEIHISPYATYSNEGFFLSVAKHEVYHSFVGHLKWFYLPSDFKVYNETMGYMISYNTQIQYGLMSDAMNTMKTAIKNGYWGNEVPVAFKKLYYILLYNL